MFFGQFTQQRQKSLCPSCLYQQKTDNSHSLWKEKCIKCGTDTIIVSGKIQIPKPNASKRAWLDWVDWLFPAEKPLTYKKGHGELKIGMDERAKQRQSIRALLINYLSRRKRK